MAVDAEHPFVRAWRTHDARELASHFAPDVVLESPILRSPFRGVTQAARLYEALFEALSDVRIDEQYGAPGRDVFVWRAKAGGRPVDGVDVIRSDADGAIVRITVLMRPLVGIGNFAAAAGPPLAGRARGRPFGVLMAVLGPGLRLVMTTIDVAARFFTQPRRDPADDLAVGPPKDTG